MKINIVIRFSDTGADATKYGDLRLPLSIDVKKDDVNKLVSASWIKQMIRNKRPGTERRRLRLIHNGRVLNDETNFRTEIFDPKLRQIRDLPEEEREQSDTSLYVHCLIGDELSRKQLQHERELDRKTQVGRTDPSVIGFDRLLSQGMSISDVNDLRRQFHSAFFPGSGPGPDRHNNGVADMEEDEDHQQMIRELEERWLDSTNGNGPVNFSSRPGSRNLASTINSGNLNNFDAERENYDNSGPANLAERGSTELEGTQHNENLLVGLLLGTFLGGVALVFLLVDDTSFNDAQKMAMVLGICINIFIAFMRAGSEYSA